MFSNVFGIPEYEAKKMYCIYCNWVGLKGKYLFVVKQKESEE